ncbi:cation transporter [Streptomyces sp. URMC 123]|uniref:cation transporter n=1 Tax=Streptomyces sp. URMC 123 TaxID=3423403 RepID=UPI003F1B5FAF
MGSDEQDGRPGRAAAVSGAVTALGLAAAKAVAGVVSGSSAMLAEAAHSLADAVGRPLPPPSPGGPAAADRPTEGHRPERRVRALLLAVAAYTAGAVFALYDGVRTLAEGGDPGDPTISYAVLAVALLVAGRTLWLRLARLRAEADRFAVPRRLALRHTPDSALGVDLVAGAAAVLGPLLAAGGLLAGRLTGSRAGDGIASLLIALLLLAVAGALGRAGAEVVPDGRSLPREMRDRVRDELLELPYVVGVLELVTVVRGPSEVLVAAKVDFTDYATAEEIEWACEDAERVLRERFPGVGKVFLDPTPGPYQTRPA